MIQTRHRPHYTHRHTQTPAVTNLFFFSLSLSLSRTRMKQDNLPPCRNSDKCTCGDQCACTEALCSCIASSVINSLSSPSVEARWDVVLHCQSCVRMAHAVLGEDAIVSLQDQSASKQVASFAEAQDYTEQLDDAGLEVALIAPVAPKSNVHRNAATASSSSPSSSCQSRSRHIDPLAVPTMTDGTDMSTPNRTIPTGSDDSPIQFGKIDVMVGGMTCSMCSKAVTTALEQTAGVHNAHVSVSTNLATIRYDPLMTGPSELTKTIKDAGYDVLEVIGHGPADRNKKSRDGSGGNGADDDNDNNDDDDENDEDRIARVMERQQGREVWKRKMAFAVSLVGTLPISIITMVLPRLFSPKSVVMQWLHSSVTIEGRAFMKESLILCVLASIVQFVSGFSFYRTAYKNIQIGMMGMDVLVALGTTASYVYGWVELWDGQPAHVFETSSVLICFVLLGKWMNSLAVRRTSEALTQLMRLQSKTAVLVDDEGNERTVSVDQINPGDTVKIIRGASIPADGVVSEGDMTVNESMITGESVPVLKTPGSLVLGGTICEESPGTYVCVTGVGSSTALAQIVQLVQDAQTRQVPIQNLADTISSFFVPTVCVLSVLTFMVWYALCNTGIVPADWYNNEGGSGKFSLMFGIACLVISCPCALGLATPTAVMVGTGVGAKHGVLMKGGDSLEATSKVDAVVFDKTGTLTVGSLSITDYIPARPSSDTPFVLWLVACLERNSEHPLAKAVVTYAEETIGDYLRDRPLEQPSDFQAMTGRGASATIQNRHVAVGNRRFAELQNVPVSDAVEARMSELEEQGKTAIIAAVDGRVAVVMGIADDLKEDASQALKYLQDQLGVDVWMVTGDNSRTAHAIAKRLHLPSDKVVAEALPVAKVQKVKKLQSEGKIVAMIGDGINDSPALAQANVGMSLGTGAQIAAEAADMVLVRGHVSDVCIALDLSRVLFRRIQWNFVFSLLYNCLGIPVAAGVFYPLLHTRLPPTLAAMAMALSSFSVVLSSLALRLYRPPHIPTDPIGIQNTTSTTTTTSTSGFVAALRRCFKSTGRPSPGTQDGSADVLGLREPLLPTVTSDDQLDLPHVGTGTSDYIEDDDDEDDDDDSIDLDVLGESDTFVSLGENSRLRVSVRVTSSDASTVSDDKSRSSSSLLDGVLGVLGIQQRRRQQQQKQRQGTPIGSVLQYEEMATATRSQESQYDEMLLRHIEEGRNQQAKDEAI